MIAGLHAHGEYSLLDGAGTAQQHVEAATAAGYCALALTDHGTLAGALHHMRACREAGILPIVGCEVYYRPNRQVQGQKDWLKVYYHLTLHAKDERGWRSLMALVSEAHRSGFYGRACVDLELLERYSDGLVCLTGCIGGVLGKSIVADDDRGAEAWLRQLKRIFRDDLFGEIMPHDLDDQRKHNVEAVRLFNKHGIPIVATLDEHYPTPDWAPAQDVLLMIATNQTVKKREKKRDEGEDVYEFTCKTLYHQTAEQIRHNFFTYHPAINEGTVDEAIRNTLIAAARCTPFLVDRNEKMPSVVFEGDETNSAKLRRLALEGLERRGYGPAHPKYKIYYEKTIFELATFEEHGVVDYMLMVWDLVQWARSDLPVPKRKNGKLTYEGPRKKPIMVGPGRGSAAGCVVSWAIGITNVNPVNYRLLFERFLNPNRKGLPDIDIDFAPDRVDEVEDFIKARYGRGNVVDIIAHSTFGPRAALTDVGRVLGVPYEHVKAATKTIDDTDRSPLPELYKVNPAVKRLADEQPQMWDIACKIQGSVARKSEHAGGILILPGAVEDFIPVERQGGQKGKLLSAFGERSGKGNALISDYGYTKIDVLRVAELMKQQHACDLVQHRTGQEIVLDDLAIHDDPYAADPKVMQGFKDGLLVGIFQFSATAAKLTRQIKPDNILELAAINALIRPGPRGAGSDQRFHRRKHGQEATVYWHDNLIPHLDYTFGELVFQEQLIEVVHHLGGLTRAEADIFRKIASKLYRDPEYAREVMGEWEVPIKAGFRRNGIDEETIEVIWTNLLSFSDYSFNLAHAAGYAVLAYRDMWLKTYFPREFYAAFLSRGLSSVTKKKALQKQEAAREMRSLPKYITETPFKILPPDIHESGRDYTVVDGGIRLGLESIKHIGPAATSAIEEHRPFADYADFEKRVPARACNITGKAALVMSGAFDRWRMRNDFTEDRIDELERDLLGMSLTSVYSIQQYAEYLDFESKFWTEDELDAAPDMTRVAVVGEVVRVKEHIDSKGQTMAFVDLAYGANNYNCTIFSYLYAEFSELLASRRPILVTGVKSTYKDKSSLKVESLPPDVNGESTPPIMDLQDYIEMMGTEAESLAGDSVYPEDLAEAIDPTSTALTSTGANALAS